MRISNTYKNLTSENKWNFKCISLLLSLVKLEIDQSNTELDPRLHSILMGSNESTGIALLNT